MTCWVISHNNIITVTFVYRWYRATTMILRMRPRGVLTIVRTYTSISIGGMINYYPNVMCSRASCILESFRKSCLVRMPAMFHPRKSKKRVNKHSRQWNDNFLSVKKSARMKNGNLNKILSFYPFLLMPILRLLQIPWIWLISSKNIWSCQLWLRRKSLYL